MFRGRLWIRKGKTIKGVPTIFALFTKTSQHLYDLSYANDFGARRKLFHCTFLAISIS